MKPTNLNMLFQDQLINFVHLLTREPMSKSQYEETVKNVYDETNPRTALFIASIQKSTFDTIRLSADMSAVLFNQ